MERSRVAPERLVAEDDRDGRSRLGRRRPRAESNGEQDGERAHGAMMRPMFAAATTVSGSRRPSDLQATPGFGGASSTDRTASRRRVIHDGHRPKFEFRLV